MAFVWLAYGLGAIARMTAKVTIEYQGGVAIVTLDNPPGNLLSGVARGRLFSALSALRHEPSVNVVVLAASGEVFSQGADLQPPAPYAASPPPGLQEIADQIDALGRPVVAALQGDVLDGGLELAMACHWRIAAPGARLGLTEARIGLPPAAGGASRLPRLVGPRRALEMITGSEIIDSAEALALGLVDGIAPGNLLASAVGHARSIVQSGLKLRSTAGWASSGQAAKVDPDLFRSFRLQVMRASPGWFALPRCVDAVQAGCLQSPAEARDLQAELAAQCRAHPQTRALLSALLSERQSALAPALPAGVKAPVIRTVALCGDSALRMATVMSEAGLTVLGEAQMDQADFIYATGRIEPKSLRRAAGPQTIIAAPSAEVPHGLTLGLRVSRIAEIVQGTNTPDAAVAAMMNLARQVGWLPVLIRRPGTFLTTALNDSWRRATGMLVDSGIGADRILRACAALGFTSRPIPVRPAQLPPRGDGGAMSDDAILAHCVSVIAEEGARLLADGTVRSAADIDVAAIHGLGFPRYRGGPMFWTSQASTDAD